MKKIITTTAILSIFSAVYISSFDDDMRDETRDDTRKSKSSKCSAPVIRKKYCEGLPSSYASYASYASISANKKEYRKMLKQYDQECQIPMFGSWFVTKRHKDNCKNLIDNLDRTSKWLRRQRAPLDLHSSDEARIFWKSLK
jgi:hypothetical protein